MNKITKKKRRNIKIKNQKQAFQKIYFKLYTFEMIEYKFDEIVEIPSPWILLFNSVSLTLKIGIKLYLKSRC